MSAKRRKPIHRCGCAECIRHPHGKTARAHRTINRVLAGLDEKSRRRCAGLLAWERGRGGVQSVHEISGLSRTTIRRGQSEIQSVDRSGGIRRAGAGRKAVEKRHRPS